jgi:hypothetical protein
MRTAGGGCGLVHVAHVRVARRHPVLAGPLAVCALSCAACSTSGGAQTTCMEHLQAQMAKAISDMGVLWMHTAGV